MSLPSLYPQSAKLVDPYEDLAQLKQSTSMKLSTETPFTPTFVQSSLTKVKDPAETYKTRIYGKQMMFDNPPRISRLKKLEMKKKERRKNEDQRLKLPIVGRRDAQSKGLWTLEPEQRRFELFVPLHFMWMGYMSELLSLPPAPPVLPMNPSPPSSAAMHAKLVKADFHGSILTVTQAKNPCLQDIRGIVIHETENAFKIITKDNKLKMIPKQNTIFAFGVPLYSVLGNDSATDASTTVLDMPHLLFTLYGNQFRFRSADRASRKFKPKMSIEL
ncbi:RNase P/MRP, p29 subunit [Flagelloscypha sp. PMI_526]|nr:RNase P/MRP, p29 subunit [Flagelloscypha sp. PMI_526]